MNEEKNNLKSIRIDRGYTLEKMAELTGGDPGTVSRHESGKRKLSIGLINKYATALECHPAEIIGDIPEAITDEKEKNIITMFRMLDSAEQEQFINIAKTFKPK